MGKRPPRINRDYYPIDRGIPLPPAARGGKQFHRTKFFPWELLKVGDSFFVPDSETSAAAVRTHMAGVQDAFGHYVSRAWYCDIKHEYGIRVWRVE